MRKIGGLEEATAEAEEIWETHSGGEEKGFMSSSAKYTSYMEGTRDATRRSEGTSALNSWMFRS